MNCFHQKLENSCKNMSRNNRMYTFAEDPIFDLEHTKYGQFLTKYIYEGHKKLRHNFDDVEIAARVAVSR